MAEDKDQVRTKSPTLILRKNLQEKKLLERNLAEMPVIKCFVFRIRPMNEL